MGILPFIEQMKIFKYRHYNENIRGGTLANLSNFMDHQLEKQAHSK